MARGNLLRAILPVLMISAAPAGAVTLFEQPGDSGLLEVPSTLQFSFNAGAGTGLARFTINGFKSLDGNNAWSDTLKVGLNGTTILSGTYDLGGGVGGDRTDIAPAGAVIASQSHGAWNGGKADFELPLDLVHGMNHFSIGYEGGGQGLGDEGWSLSALSITGPQGPKLPALKEILSQPAPTGMLESPGSVAFDFVATGGKGFVSFDLNGYNSLDGNNAWSDLFTLSLNGVDLLQGSYDLGGGGGNRTDFAPVGSLVAIQSYGTWNGGLGRFQIPLELLQGQNKLTFSYTGTPQGLADEGWGISNLRLSEYAGAVPEPTSWILMIAGFGLIGAAARRRRTAVAA